MSEKSRIKITKGLNKEKLEETIWPQKVNIKQRK